jgi:hypothetical protein
VSRLRGHWPQPQPPRSRGTPSRRPPGWVERERGPYPPRGGCRTESGFSLSPVHGAPGSGLVPLPGVRVCGSPSASRRGRVARGGAARARRCAPRGSFGGRWRSRARPAVPRALPAPLFPRVARPRAAPRAQRRPPARAAGAQPPLSRTLPRRNGRRYLPAPLSEQRRSRA